MREHACYVLHFDRELEIWSSDEEAVVRGPPNITEKHEVSSDDIFDMIHAKNKICNPQCPVCEKPIEYYMVDGVVYSYYNFNGGIDTGIKVTQLGPASRYEPAPSRSSMDIVQQLETTRGSGDIDPR